MNPLDRLTVEIDDLECSHGQAQLDGDTIRIRATRVTANLLDQGLTAIELGEDVEPTIAQLNDIAGRAALQAALQGEQNFVTYHDIVTEGRDVLVAAKEYTR